jgi:hypothetical protein
MMKNIKKVRTIFMCIAVLAIIMHMVIPHDHHQADSFACQDRECPVSDDNGGHHTGMPVHCHACNDLTSEKSVILVVVSHFESKCFIAGNSVHYMAPVLNQANYTENKISGNHTDSVYPGINLLRAPPSII